MMKRILILAAAVAALCACGPKLVIVHCNDTHSHFDPLRDGRGGIIERAAFIDSVRKADGADKVHLLKIDFDCKAEDYGTTSVPETFVPADYDLISFDEYQAKYEAQAEEGTSEFMDEFEKLVSEDPGTIEFLGNVYETQMSMYVFSDEEANG